MAQVPGFPQELKVLLEHLIISHHGQYEFGSPKLPMFPEALMLHFLDDLDSKMEAMRAHFEREAGVDSPWTTYNPSLGRPLLNPEKFLRASAAEAPAEPTPAAAPPASAPGETSADDSQQPARPDNAQLRLLERKFDRPAPVAPGTRNER